MLLPPLSWKFTVDSTPRGISPLAANATLLVALTPTADTSMSMPRSRFVGPIW